MTEGDVVQVLDKQATGTIIYYTKDQDLAILLPTGFIIYEKKYNLRLIKELNHETS